MTDQVHVAQSAVSKEETFDRTIDLVIGQDDVIHRWFAIFVTVQTGFAIAVAALLSWKASSSSALVLIAAGLLVTLAIILAVAINAIVRRNMDWQAAYIGRVKALQEIGQEIFIDGMVPPGPRMTDVFRYVEYAVVTAWLLFFLLAIIAKLTGTA